MPARKLAPCKAPGCPSKAWNRGLCKAHLRRATGEKQGPVKHYARNKGHLCRLVCDRPAHTLGLCKRHYRRKQEGLDNWHAPLLHRAVNGSLPLGRVRVRHKYADFYRMLAEGLGMTLNALATYLLEEYAQNRLNEQAEAEEELTAETWRRKE